MKEEKETVQLRQVKLVVENDGVSSSPSYNGQPGSAVIMSGPDMTSGNDNPAFVPEDGLTEKEANVSIDVSYRIKNSQHGSDQHCHRLYIDNSFRAHILLFSCLHKNFFFLKYKNNLLEHVLSAQLCEIPS